MAYTPTEWKKGDVVTSEKLNKLEEGVAAGGSLFVDITTEQDDSHTLSETFGTIKEAFLGGQQIWIRDSDFNVDAIIYLTVTQMGTNKEDGGGYLSDGNITFYAADDLTYPTDSVSDDGGGGLS